MESAAEYVIMSKIYVNEKKTSPFWTFVKVILIIYTAVSLFKIVMDGYIDFRGIFGNIAIPLLLLGAAFLRSGRMEQRKGYIPLRMTIRFYPDKMQIIMGMHDFSDGAGNRVRICEVFYSDIRGGEYSIPLVCLRIAGRSQVFEYRNEAMAEKGENFRTFSSDQDLYLYLEKDRAEEIVEDLKRLSGCQVNCLH